MKVIGMGHRWREPLRIRGLCKSLHSYEPLGASFHGFSSPTHFITESFHCARDTVGPYPHLFFLFPSSQEKASGKGDPSSSSWCRCAWNCSCHLLQENNNMSSNASITQLPHSHPHPFLPLPWIILKQIPIIILFPTKISVCIFKRLEL